MRGVCIIRSKVRRRIFSRFFFSKGLKGKGHESQIYLWTFFTDSFKSQWNCTSVKQKQRKAFNLVFFLWSVSDICIYDEMILIEYTELEIPSSGWRSKKRFSAYSLIVSCVVAFDWKVMVYLLKRFLSRTQIVSGHKLFSLIQKVLRCYKSTKFIRSSMVKKGLSVHTRPP